MDIQRKLAVATAVIMAVTCLAACGGTATPTAAPVPASLQAGTATFTVVPIAAPMPSPSAAAPATPAPTAMPLPVAVQTVAVEDKYVEIHTLYPVVSGMKDRPFEKDMNEQAKNGMLARVKELQAQAKAFHKEAKERDFPFNQFTLDANISVHTNDGTLLSMTNRFYTYTGGAHGISDGIYTNVLNTLPARSLTLPRIFTDPAKGIERINRQIKAQMGKEDYFFPDTFKTVDDKTWFYIERPDLVIVFPEYAIAPYAAGEPEFKIPLTSLSDILIPGIAR